MDEILKRDQNRVTVLAGVTDDADLDIVMLRVDPVSKKLLVKATGLVSGVTSVSNSNGTLTISPTTGAVVASLNLGNANTWTATQTFDIAKANTVQAVGSGGLLFKSNSGTDVALFGAGGGAGVTFYDGISQAGQYSNTFTSLASTPAGTFTGTWFTGGTATTTKPHFLIEPSGATSTGWSTNGTGFGVNAASGFTGNLFDFQQNGVSTLKFSGATTSPLLTMTAASGSNNAKIWFTGQGNATDFIIGSSNAASYPSHAFIIAASNSLTFQGGTSASGRLVFNSTLVFADQKAWNSSNTRQFFMVSENSGNAQARVTFGPTIFTPTGTTESFFTWNGAVNGVAGSTVALAGIRQSQTITPNAATTGTTYGYQMINSMVATANNQTFVGIDLSSTFTPGAFTGLSAIRLRIGAGSTTTVPVQFNSGSLATQALVGGMEFLTDKWYGTITTGIARKEFTLNDIALTSGQMPFVTTNGRLSSNANMTTDGSGNLGISGAFAAGSYTDFANTKSGTQNGITVDVTNQLSSTTVTVSAVAATAAQAGIVTTSAQTYGGVKTFDDGIIIGAGATATLRLKGYTVATLPAGVAGEEAYVNDALAPVLGNNVVGGGAAYAKVWYNNANWTVTGI
jgi:hypothetical protein